MLKNTVFRILHILLSVFTIQLVNAQTDTYAIRMAESIMNRNSGVYGSWNYETATVLRGFEELYRVTGDDRFYNYIKSTVDNVVSSSGSINRYSMSEYNLDQVKEGSTVLYLYSVTGDQRYRSAAQTLMQQLNNQPRTNDGGNWHKNKYPNQMWLDGLYMAQPFNANYGFVFNQSANFDDVVLQLTLMEDHARDSNSGLLYHGWDESRSASWANPSTGTSPVFWARSLGWYAMALVDVLDFIPKQNIAQRDTILAILNRLVPAVADVQDQASGVWWQVPDKGGQSGNWLESSSTAMFVYAIFKAVRNNYIDASYLSVAENGWNGLLNEFVTTSGSNLNLTDTCEGTGVGGSYSFYIGRAKKTNDPKGLGPFLLAAVEVELSNADINRAPIISKAINDMSLLLNDPAVQINLNTVFIDPNGDTLSFSHSASSGTDINVSLSGSIMIITPNEIGSVVHSLTANDGNGGQAETAFVVNVVGVGDVNSDGDVNIIDALMVAQYYVGLDPANINSANGDVNCDGSISILDALAIAQFYVGLINAFCL